MVRFMSLICLLGSTTTHCMFKSTKNTPLKPYDQKALLFAHFSAAVGREFGQQIQKYKEPTVVYCVMKNKDLEDSMKYVVNSRNRKNGFTLLETSHIFNSLETMITEDAKKNSVEISPEEMVTTPTPTYDEAIASEIEL